MNRLKSMRRTLVCTIFASLFASTVHAGCGGTDLRLALSSEDRQNLTHTLSEMPFKEGNHWRATRADQTIHFVGTIHLSDPRLDPIETRLKGVIETSDLLLLEMTPVEEAAMKSDIASRPELIFLQGATLPELLEESEWTALMAAMKKRGIPPILASRFQPWYLSVLLAMPPCLAQSAMGGDQIGLDHRLRDIAIAANVPLLGLEPHDTLFQLFDNDPLEEQIDVMMLGLSTQDQSPDMLETVKAAYFEQRHGEAWEMSRWSMMQIRGDTPERLAELFAEMENDLLTARNEAWIPVILNALDGQRQITVAAGAGHLSGAKGVLALIEAQGFKLERLPF